MVIKMNNADKKEIRALLEDYENELLITIMPAEPQFKSVHEKSLEKINYILEKLEKND